MDQHKENSNFTSSLRPPSKIPSPMKLQELPASAGNVRLPTTGIPIQTGPLRKTLVERAGEPLQQAGLFDHRRSGRPHVQGSSLSGISRHNAMSSAVSAQSGSNMIFKGNSNRGFASTIGPGSRPPTHASSRIHSSSGNSRVSKSHYQHRSATSQGIHQETRQVLGKRKSWDTEQRLGELEQFTQTLKKDITGATAESEHLREMTTIYKTRIAELETQKASLISSNTQLQGDIDSARNRVTVAAGDIENLKRQHSVELDDLQRQARRDKERLLGDMEDDRRREIKAEAQKLEDLQRSMDSTMDEVKLEHRREVEALIKEGTNNQYKAREEVEAQCAALRRSQDDFERAGSQLMKEKEITTTLRTKLTASEQQQSELQNTVQRLEGHIRFLESDNKSQSHAFGDLEARMQNALRQAAEANEKLIKEETLRRKLHNQVQELKGNIRVFCRVRPALTEADTNEAARIDYPDESVDAKEVELMGPQEKSSLGNVTTRKHTFSFDRVFGPKSQNEDVFGEISQLVQSALDGYNVCIFCYGQTGSGKTHTMSSLDGMIPRAVKQIYSTAQGLEEKGWSYHMEGSFIEVYNENINDLLGKSEDLDKKKHEIRHDMQRLKTEVTGVRTVHLDKPQRVEEILQRASKNRSVAATQANERSSRSHSVFILKLIGENSITGERSEGTLNLVDLAGSERLSQSGATGERLKETQNINKSLSCLGDVIGALGQGKDGGHVPYRNSKLTYLLQFSLGGNSKTLMFVMISPLQAHLSESLTSLKFATKVHNTHIGTAKKQTKSRD